jgi:hypothetical protein
VSKRDEASGSALLEVSGLNITPYAHVSGGREGAPVLVLAFSSDRVLPAGGAAPAADLQISSGQLRQATGGIRVAAALQQPGAGAAVVSRAGDLIGFAMLRADTAPRLVAGVVPESTYPITLVDALAAADAAGSRPSEKTAGEILASVGAALVRVTCPSAP